MASTDLPFMKTNPSVIFFTDFDGTITLEDISYKHNARDLCSQVSVLTRLQKTDYLGYGPVTRRERHLDVLDGRSSFRDAFYNMLDSVKTPFNECIDELCQKMKLDPHFVEFFEWAQANNVPVVVLSSGMIPIISALLQKLLGYKPDNLHIIANDVEVRDGKDINSHGGWQIKYRDESHFGHDKSRTIKPYAGLPSNVRPTLLYAGDGISDLSAAAETDLLFAKKGKDLVTYCQRQGMPFAVFEDWSSILATTRDIASGKVSVQDVAQEALKREQGNKS